MADAKNTPVVDVWVVNPLHSSMEGDDGPVWDEAPDFSVETRPSDCVDVNLWDRDPVYEDPVGFYESGCPDRLCVWGLAGQTGRMSW